MPVPLFDTRTPLAPLMPQLTAKAVEVLERGSYILGPEVEAFEREFADHLGARHAIGVANGTDALTIALRALGVGPGDEVVVPSFTFYASAEAVPPTGARPVFCDVDPETACVTAETVAAALTPRTKAVIVVDLFGNLAPAEEIAALGVPVIEDAAQAAGSRTADGRRAGALGASLATFSFFPSKNLPAFGDGGAVVTDDDALADAVRMLRFHGSRDKVVVDLFGNLAPAEEIAALGVPVIEDAAQAAGSQTADGRRAGALGASLATFSFFPSKNLPAFGDGGAVVTDDDALADAVRMLRFHGSRDKVSFEQIGFNSRLDELQAALLRLELPHLEAWAEGRRATGGLYEAGGLGELVALPRAADGCRPAWHLYVVCHPRVDVLAGALRAAGIGHKAYYRVPTHCQPAMREYADGAQLPATDELARTHLAIPMSPVLTEAQAAEVIAAVRDARLG